jgi:aminoacyl-tRNA hydrolase
VGFRVVEELARRGGVSLAGEECGSLVALVPDPGGARPPVLADAAGQAGVAGLAGRPGEDAGAPAGEPAVDGSVESGASEIDAREPASVLLVQPQTYMNRSGYAARCFAERHGLAPADFLVVYDEINLPLGRLRLRRGGSPAGHRGMESILENLRTDEVPRLRLGVAPERGSPPGADLVEFVLAPFETGDQEAVDAMIARAADACEAWLKQGVEAAMNRFNR